MEDPDTMEHPSEHDDRQSEHSEHEPENHPPENEEGKHIELKMFNILYILK